MSRSVARSQQPQKLYIAYAEQDSRFRAELALHLAPLQRQGEVIFWHDRLILPGQDRESITDSRLEESDIILLLVSPDLLASDYVYEREVRRALELHLENRAIAIPILLRPSFWQRTPLSRLHPLPANSRAIKLWTDRDLAWLHVIEGIYSLVRQRRI